MLSIFDGIILAIGCFIIIYFYMVLSELISFPKRERVVLFIKKYFKFLIFHYFLLLGLFVGLSSNLSNFTEKNITNEDDIFFTIESFKLVHSDNGFPSYDVFIRNPDDTVSLRHLNSLDYSLKISDDEQSCLKDVYKKTTYTNPYGSWFVRENDRKEFIKRVLVIPSNSLSFKNNFL